MDKQIKIWDINRIPNDRDMAEGDFFTGPVALTQAPNDQQHKNFVRDVAWAPSVGLTPNMIASCDEVRCRPDCRHTHASYFSRSLAPTVRFLHLRRMLKKGAPVCVCVFFEEWRRDDMEREHARQRRDGRMGTRLVEARHPLTVTTSPLARVPS